MLDIKLFRMVHMKATRVPENGADRFPALLPEKPANAQTIGQLRRVGLPAGVMQFARAVAYFAAGEIGPTMRTLTENSGQTWLPRASCQGDPRCGYCEIPTLVQ
jgi:hypothetical protein